MGTQSQEHQLYYDAITQPLRVEEVDLLRLIDKYPYSQPLRYALLQKQTLSSQHIPAVENTLLYAPDVHWLWSYVHTPTEVIEEIMPTTEDYVPFEEYEEKNEGQPESEVDSEVYDETAETVPKQAADQTNGQVDEVPPEEEMERLVHSAGISGDYFVFEQKEKGIAEEQVVEDASVVGENEQTEDENISLYNDELMPYSFRWWLYKTRLEHADTYQPYATPIWPQPQKGQFDPKKLDEAILDQQIKESIIHFQDPEMKLSEEVKNRPVEPVTPKKGAEIIEKFIQEEPIIHPPSPEQLNTENMARQSAEDNYMLVTETLANIYIEQGLYSKAIEVFKKLILRYPEKKSYFAARIQELEKNL